MLDYSPAPKIVVVTSPRVEQGNENRRQNYSKVSRTQSGKIRHKTPIVLQEPQSVQVQDPNAVYLGASFDLLPKKTEKLSLYEPNINRFYASKSRLITPRQQQN